MPIHRGLEKLAAVACLAEAQASQVGSGAALVQRGSHGVRAMTRAILEEDRTMAAELELQLFGRSVWFKDLNEPHLAGRVFDYIEAALADGELGAVPDDLRGHVYERYLTPADASPEMTFAMVDGDLEERDGSEDLDGLDPVCLMDVDPTTARFTVEHEGRTYAFCGPGCRREFIEDPAAFVGATQRPTAAG